MNTIVHSAARRDLDRCGAALASFPAGRQARADPLKTSWDWYAAERRGPR